MPENADHYAPLDPFKTGIRGCCPRCGHGRLFEGLLSVKPRCSACGLDYSFADAGDGPAVFVILIFGFLVLGTALWMQVTYSPPTWLLGVIFGPIAIVASLLALRWGKGIMIALQFRHNAHEGRLGTADDKDR